jgi:uncharacterized protein YdeI (YjbR/CyaY-like superfamily)
MTTKKATTTRRPPDGSVHPKTRAQWGTWLARNHARAEGVWLITYKMATGRPRVDYNDAVEEALRFGWIDSKPRALDGERSMLWFAPRKPRTNWSKANRERVERLMAGGRMAAPGLAKVLAAQRDGSWDALVGVESLEVPPDLRRALAKQAEAARNFDAFPPSVKRGILEWIHNARQPATRTKRIEETARLAAKNIRANQWRQPKGAV